MDNRAFILSIHQFDGSGTPTVTHDGFGGGALPDPSRSRLHYNDKGNVFSQEDEIDEYRADFTLSRTMARAMPSVSGVISDAVTARSCQMPSKNW